MEQRERQQQRQQKPWIEWKWTFGGQYERSPRSKQQAQRLPQQQQEPTVDPSELAFQQSFLSENDPWSLEEQQIFVPQQQSKPNKREDTYNRMAEREMVGTVGMNPFMNNHNYLDDVMTQDHFLKPVSTSMERSKEDSLI